MKRTQQITLPADLGAQPGLLVFDGETLLAVLGYLDEAHYENEQGKWHVEASFTRAIPSGQVLDDVSGWLDLLDWNVAVAPPKS